MAKIELNYSDALRKLVAEGDADGKSGLGNFLNSHMGWASLAGDPEALIAFSEGIEHTILSGQEFTPFHKLWLFQVMKRLQHRKTAVAVSREVPGSKGAPRRIALSARIALQVFTVLFDIRASSMEDAWEIVAEEGKMSVSKVKACWIENRQFVINWLELSPNVPDGEALLKEIMAMNKECNS